MPIDLTRSLLVVLIPGAVAVAPWLFWLSLVTDGYAEKQAPVAHAVAFACAVIAGLICESLGTWLEVAWDKRQEVQYKIRENWFAYLAGKHDPEPVGYRYLSRLATTFYFELSMMVALVPFASGAASLLFIQFPERRELLMPIVGIATVAMLIYFWINARQTHQVLCRTRAEMNRRLKK